MYNDSRRTFRVVLVVLEGDVTQVQHPGDDGVDRGLLRGFHPHQRHRVVHDAEVTVVVELDVAQTSVLQELNRNARPTIKYTLKKFS